MGCRVAGDSSTVLIIGGGEERAPKQRGAAPQSNNSFVYVRALNKGRFLLNSFALSLERRLGWSSCSSTSPGPAALVCAETLRQGSYGGRIIMATKEELPPYDRTKLSKV